jgi:hypothetical protein
MKNIFKKLVFVLLAALAVSCSKSDSFLSTSPTSDYGDVAVWSDPALVQTYIFTMYRNAMAFPLAVEKLSDLVDESMCTFDGATWDFNKGLMSPDVYRGWWTGSNTQKVDMFLEWNTLYSNLRRANIFFSKINSVPGAKPVIDGMKGEVYFLRAWSYFYLTAYYGGVPLITKPYTLTDKFEVPRDSYEACISFIVSQLDSSAMNLPDVYPKDGRITKELPLH